MDSCSVMLESVQGEGPIDAGANNLIRDKLQRIQEQLVIDRAIKGTAVAAIGVDSPVHFDFDAFVTEVFTDVLSREAQRNPNLRNYAGTLQLRLEQGATRPSVRILFSVPPSLRH